MQFKRGCHHILNTVCESIIYKVIGIWSFIWAHFELHILEQKMKPLAKQYTLPNPIIELDKAVVCV